MEDLIIRIRIKEDNRRSEINERASTMRAKANIVKNKSKDPRKGFKSNERNKTSKPQFKKNPSGDCFISEKPRHFTR